MNLFDIVISNLRRRKSRAAFLLVGLAVSAATAVALFLLGRGITTDITEKLDTFGANIVIVPDSSGLTLSYAGITVTGVNTGGRELSESDLDALKKIKNAGNIRVVAPKLAGQTVLNGQPVLVSGVRFEDEFFLKKWWRIGAGGKPGATGDLLIGSHVATQFGLGPGSAVTLGNQPARVAGILSETGGQDDGLIFLDLPFAQALLGKPGRLSLIELAALCTGCPIEDMVGQISGALPGARVKAMKETLSLKMAAMSQFHNFSYGVSAIILFVAALIVFTSMMGAVGERRKEIGLFRAVGYRRGHIMQIILLEAALIGLLGGIAGFLAGTGVPRLVAPYLMHTEGLRFPPDIRVAAVVIAATAFLALLASLVPALRASQLDPSETLRDL